MQKQVVSWEHDGVFQERVCATEKELWRAVREAVKVGARYTKKPYSNGNSNGRGHKPTCRRSSPRYAFRR